MSVYVDECIWPFGRMMMCHMLADTEQELLAMADKIGVARKWIQRKSCRPTHFDICKSKRVQAVSNGAIECNRKEIVAIMNRILAKQPIVGGDLNYTVIPNENP